MIRVGIIGGTGIYEFGDSILNLETPYGDVSLWYSQNNKQEIFFLPRHEKEHCVPPHKVNYMGNIHALRSCRVERIIALSTVGSMRKEMKVGDIFIPLDFIDYTKRNITFFENEAVHVDMSQPFCPEVRNILMAIAKKYAKVHEGTYVVTEGPRLETKAEIHMFSKFAHVVGMTLMPEAVLAKEKGMCYASLCLISNMAAGLQEKLPADEIIRIYNDKKNSVIRIVEEAIKLLPPTKKCSCEDAVKTGKIV